MSDKKKQLLNESTVRRFMGLAGIGALSNNFINEQVPPLPDSGGMDFKGTDTTAPKPTEFELPSLEEQEDEMAPPLPGEEELDAEGPLPGEEEFGDEEVEDIDLSQEEADVLISLGRKLEGEMPEGEEELPPEGEEGLPPAGMGGLSPEEELPPGPGPMAEALVHELTTRVSNRLKKEYVISEVMKRVARRLR